MRKMKSYRLPPVTVRQLEQLLFWLPEWTETDIISWAVMSMWDREARKRNYTLDDLKATLREVGPVGAPKRPR